MIGRRINFTRLLAGVAVAILPGNAFAQAWPPDTLLYGGHDIRWRLNPALGDFIVDTKRFVTPSGWQLSLTLSADVVRREFRLLVSAKTGRVYVQTANMTTYALRDFQPVLLAYSADGGGESLQASVTEDHLREDYVVVVLSMQKPYGTAESPR